MQRIQSPSNVPVMPDQRDFERDPGYFSAGDPANGVMPTMVTAEWLNGVQEEIVTAIEDAGITPDSANVNQMASALRIIAQDAVLAVVHEITEGGIESWASTVDYVAGDVVRGSDASIYVAKNASGPSSTVVDPVSDSTGKWGKIALDADVVKLTGAQTISGLKKFTNDITLEEGAPGFNTRATYTTKGTAPSSTQWQGITFGDKNGDRIAGFSTSYTNAKDVTLFLITNKANASADTDWFSVNVRCYANGTSCFFPNSNGTSDLGLSVNRWSKVWAATGTIQTSDERLKSSINPIPDAVLDVWEGVQWKQFQFNDSVSEKGMENARLHTGLIAQRIDEVFKAQGLDASRYGLFCHDTWDAQPEEKDDNGNIMQEARDAGDAYSLRYDEALAMEAAYQRRRADRADARITSLEQRLGELEAVLASLISPVGEEQTADAQEGEGADA